MVEQIEIKNLNYQKGFILNRTDAEYLLDDNGVDWGSVPSRISSYNSIDGLGGIVNKVSISKSRTIQIIGWIIPGEQATIEEKKSYLSKICNPMDVLRIYCGAYTIEGVMKSTVKFANKTDENNEEMCKFSLSLDCAYPFFIKHIEKQLGAGTNNPLYVESSTYDDAGNITHISSYPIELENPGDFDVGAEFLITLSNAYKNLRVITKDPKTTLFSYFSLLGVLQEDTIFRVNTTPNHKYVSDYGAWDLNSDWVKIYKALSPKEDSKDWCLLTIQADIPEGSLIKDFEGIQLTIEYDVPYTSMEGM